MVDFDPFTFDEEDLLPSDKLQDPQKPATPAEPQDPYARILASEAADKAVIAPKTQEPAPDPYSEILKREAKQKDDLQVATYNLGVKSDPEKARVADKYARMLGKPVGLVERNLDEVRQLQAMQQFRESEMSAFSPFLRAQLRNPSFARMAHDDTIHLDGWTRTMMALERGSLLVERGKLGARMAIDFSDVPNKAMLDRLTQINYRLDNELPESRGIEANTAEVLGQMINTVPQALALGLATAAPVALATSETGPGVLITTPTAFAVGFGGSMLGQVAMIEGGNQYVDLIGKGVDRSTARLAGIGVGIVNGVLEMVSMSSTVGLALEKLGVQRLTKGIRDYVSKEIAGTVVGGALQKAATNSAALKAALRYAEGVGTEVGTEVLQEVSNIIAEGATTGDWEGVAERLGEIALKTTQGMALLGLPGPVFAYAMERADAKMVQEENKRFGVGMQNALQSKLRKDNPEAFQRFAEEKTRGTPQETIYMNAQAVADALQQHDKVSVDSGKLEKSMLDQLEVAMPGITERLRVAAEQKGDISVPTAEYMAKLSPELDEVLRPHTRFTQKTGMSPAEAEQQDLPAMKTEAEQRALAQLQKAAKWQAEGETIKQTFETEMTAAGVKPNVAKAHGTLVKLFFDMAASHSGVSPGELFEEYRIKVQAGEFAPGAAGLQQFAGEKALTSDPVALQEAKDMLATGADPEEIRRETGWHQGTEGKWRFEIADNEAKILVRPFQGSLPLSQVLDHPKLFEAYPDLAHLNVSQHKAGREQGSKGSFNPATLQISLNESLPDEEAASVLLHEIQHYIQRREEFARGGDPGMFTGMERLNIKEKDLLRRLDEVSSGHPEAVAKVEAYKKLEVERVETDNKRAAAVKSGRPAAEVAALRAKADEASAASNNALGEVVGDVFAKSVYEARNALQDFGPVSGYEAYKRLAGEVEARNTQDRQNMTAGQRAQVSPASTADVAAAEQIIRDVRGIVLARDQANTDDTGAAGGDQAAAGAVQDGRGLRGSDQPLDGSAGPVADAPPLAGLPATVTVDGQDVAFGPSKTARQAAIDYMRRVGLPYRPATVFAPVEVGRATRIAQAYEAMQNAPNDPQVRAAYKALARETIAQYEAMLAAGVKVEFNPASLPDPYPVPRHALLDLQNNNHLFIYSTEEGYGQAGITDAQRAENPMLQDSGHKFGDRVALVNDLFRAVHDYFGHFKEGVGFRARGEENAWQQHMAMYSELARKAATSETRGQNSWVNFGPKAAQNKGASGAKTVYAEQKIGLLPDWVLTEGYLGETPAAEEAVSRVTQKTRQVRQLLKNLTPAEQKKVTDRVAAKILAQLQDLPSATEIAAIAEAGKAKRGWYRKSAQALLDIFGVDAPRFAALLAATSPQTSVEANLQNALTIWKNWIAAGRPTTRGEIVEIMGRSVQGGRGVESVLDAWVNNSVRALSSTDLTKLTLSGPKVNSFFRNLVGVTSEVTNDAWMANFSLVDQTIFSGSLNVAGNEPGKSVGYLAMNARIREAAGVLSKLSGETWTPAEVQETVWSWAKTLYELQVGDLTATEALDQGLLTDELLASTPDFSSLFTQPAYAGIIAGTYGKQLEQLRAGRAVEPAAAKPVQEPGAGGEAGAFAPEARRKFERRAAKRLEQLRAQREQESAERLKQEDEEGVTRGFITFDGGKSTISLTKAKNLSSGIHELGHAFLEIYAHMATRKLSPVIVDDFNALLGWLGVKDIATWNKMSLKEKEPFHERFARSYEGYMFRGEEPVPALKKLFKRFSEWLRRVYTALSDIVGAEKLPPNIQAVFDRMFASENAVRATWAIRGAVPIFQTQEQSGMNDADWAKHQAKMRDQEEEAIDELTRKSLRAARIAGQLKGEELGKLNAVEMEVRAGVKDDATREVQAQPVYASQQFFKTGVWVHPDGTREELTGLHKLDRDEFLRTGWFGDLTAEEALARFNGMLITDGLSLDEAGSTFGYDSGEEMIRAILGAPPIEAAIEQRTDEIMREDYTELSSAEEIETSVDQAIHNDVRREFVAAELDALQGSVEPTRVTRAAAKKAAEQSIDNRLVDDMDPRAFTLAAREASLEAAEWLEKGETLKAWQAKRAELLQEEMALLAIDARDAVDRTVRDMRRFNESDRSIGKTRDIDLIYAGRALAVAYGFRRPFAAGQETQLAAEALESLIKDHPDLASRLLPLLQKAQNAPIPFKTLTVGKLREIKELGDWLWEASRDERELTIAGEQVPIDEATDAIVAGLGALPPRSKTAKAPEGETPGWLRQRLMEGWEALASSKMMEHVARALDGDKSDGPVQRFLVRELVNATTVYRDQKAEMFEPLVKALLAVKQAAGERWRARINASDLVRPGTKPFTFRGKIELLGAILHAGTESNMGANHVGRGWVDLVDDGQGGQILDTRRWDRFIARMWKEGWLNETDQQFLNTWWGTFAKLLPQAQKVHKKRFGFPFKTIEEQPVLVGNKMLRGGYVPKRASRYEADPRMFDAARDNKLTSVENFQYSVGARKGFTLGRDESYRPPLTLNVVELLGNVDEELRFIHLELPAHAVEKILRNKRESIDPATGQMVEVKVEDVLNAFDRELVNGVIRKWAGNVALQRTSIPGSNRVFDAAARLLHAAGSLTRLAFNLPNAMLQAGGVSNAAAIYPVRRVLSATRTFFLSPFQSYRTMRSKSRYMAQEYDGKVQKLQQLANRANMNAFVGTVVASRQFFGEMGRFAQTAFQLISNTITWHAGYAEAIAKGASEREAIAQADHGFRVTQGNAKVENLPAHMVTTPVAKTWLQFSNYSNLVLNNLFGSRGRKMRTFAFAILLPAVWELAIKSMFGGGVDDDDNDGSLIDDLAKRYAKTVARNTVGLIPVGGPALLALAGSDGERVLESPASTVLKDVWGGVMAGGEALLGGETTEAKQRKLAALLSIISGIGLSAPVSTYQKMTK